jgi:hypothetical protein
MMPERCLGFVAFLLSFRILLIFSILSSLHDPILISFVDSKLNKIHGQTRTRWLVYGEEQTHPIT